MIAESVNNAVAGFTTSSKTKPIIVAKLEEFIRNKLITLRSPRMHEELKTFIWHNGRPQAMRGYNDDLTMSLCIGCWIKDTVLTVNRRDVAYKKAFLDSMIMTRTNLETRIRGQHGYKEKFDTDKREIEKRIQPHLWLYKG